MVEFQDSYQEVFQLIILKMEKFKQAEDLPLFLLLNASINMENMIQKGMKKLKLTSKVLHQEPKYQFLMKN